MNAVLHEWANAWENVVGPNASPSKFRNTLPPAVTWAGQEIGESSLVPSARSAAPVRILNVDPGG
jgi:hypothetical protein